MIAAALSCLCMPAALSGQAKVPLILGMKIDSKEMQDSLSLPFWRALANSSCPKISWKPNYSSDAAFQASIKPLRDRLSKVVGVLRQPAGLPLERRIVYQGPRYIVERVAFSNRLGNTSFGYLARPNGTSSGSAPVLLIHGSGMAPQEAFDWQFPDQYGAEMRFDSTAFVGAGLELAEAGYTVLSLWLADDELDSYWPRATWQLLNRNGAMLAAKTRGPGTYYVLANEVAGAVDFLIGLPGVDASKVGVIGWGEGAQIAMLVAALNGGVKAVVRLEAPLDRRPLRSTVLGVLGESAFTHLDCSLGDVEMAALIARPLLYAYSSRDSSVARFAAFISPSVESQIRAMYASLENKPMFAVQADSSWSIGKNMRSVRTWLDAALAFDSRDVPTRVIPPRRPPNERYHNAFIDSTQLQRREFIASLGACGSSPEFEPDFRSIDQYNASVEPLRRRLAQALRVALPVTSPTFRIVRRDTVLQQAKYLLEYVELASSRTNIPVSGLLATPTVGAPRGLPAVISLDGNDGLAGPFGLKGREGTRYLNAYADELASSGNVVFVPYSPSSFPEIAATELRARNPDGPTSWSYVIPVYQAAVDFALSLPSVDSTRIGMWGISYAAFPALFTTALDLRVSTLLFSNPVLTYDLLFQSPDGAGLSAWFGEICSVLDTTLTYLIAPRRLVRENGARDANGYERFPLESIENIRQVYVKLGVPAQFQFARHQGGHETQARSIF
jgi:dienelactone hydrolase